MSSKRLQDASRVSRRVCGGWRDDTLATRRGICLRACLGGLATLAAVAWPALGLAAPPPPATAPGIDPAADALAQAETYVRQRQYEQALKSLETAARFDSNLPPARLMLARKLLVEAGRLAGPAAAAAKVQLELAAVEHPDHPEVYLQLAGVALGESRLTEAVLSCTAALQLAEANRWSAPRKAHFRREARLLLSLAWERRGRWDEARAHLLAVLEADPRHGPARQRLGRALFGLGRFEEAAAELARAVADDPSLEPYELTMAGLWSAKGEPPRAREWFQKAVAAHSGVGRVHFEFANWLLDQGLDFQAKVHADTAVKLSPNIPDAARLKALVARHLRDYVVAERILEGLHENAPSDVDAANQLALVYIESTDPTRRAKAAEIADLNARQFPNNPELTATRGWIAYRLGNPELAEQLLSQAVSVGRTTADTAYYLAVVLADKNQHQQARQLLDGALKSTGRFVNRRDAQALLDKLPPPGKPPAQTPAP